MTNRNIPIEDSTHVKAITENPQKKLPLCDFVNFLIDYSQNESSRKENVITFDRNKLINILNQFQEKTEKNFFTFMLEFVDDKNIRLDDEKIKYFNNIIGLARLTQEQFAQPITTNMESLIEFQAKVNSSNGQSKNQSSRYKVKSAVLPTGSYDTGSKVESESTPKGLYYTGSIDNNSTFFKKFKNIVTSIIDSIKSIGVSITSMVRKAFSFILPKKTSYDNNNHNDYDDANNNESYTSSVGKTQKNTNQESLDNTTGSPGLLTRSYLAFNSTIKPERMIEDEYEDEDDNDEKEYTDDGNKKIEKQHFGK